jgi:non-ribosomal peptide synthetase component F
VASYERVLQAVAVDAQQRVLEIGLLGEAERRQVIEGWNEPEREYAPALTLSELFEAQAARTPEAPALSFEDITLSYRELNERANQLAHYLQRSGVGPDVLVGILMHRSVEMIVAVLGILKAGGAYVPLDPSYPRERLAFMVQDAGVRMLLTQEELLNEVPGEYVGQTLSLDQQWDEITGESVENLLSVAQPESLAYVIYTSGSTGQPKGVLVSHENVVRLLDATQAHFEFNQRDVWTLFHPMLLISRSGNSGARWRTAASSSSSLTGSAAQQKPSIACWSRSRSRC